MSEPLIPEHGGYRNLKSFQMARLAYDVTKHFCDRFIDKRSRTHDQMVQAARSGTQNIAEGSKASATSKKMVMKLTNVARASLEELRLDYEDYLRQGGLPQWPPNHPALMRYKARHCQSLSEVLDWVKSELGQTSKGTGTKQGQTGTDKDGEFPESPCAAPVGPSPSEAVLLANAALSILNVACYLLTRQLESQAAAFEQDGGFTERLYRTRRDRRGPT